MSIESLLRKPNIDEYYEDIKLLIDSDPSALQQSTVNRGLLPIHIALINPNITLRVVQLLLKGRPESIFQPAHEGYLPIHSLCLNEGLDETVLIDILSLLIEVFPESVQRQASDGELPIHTAASSGMSLEVIKILVGAYPESVGIHHGSKRMLPIHWACYSPNCRLDSVKYLLNVYPESINVGDRVSWLPFHFAANSEGPQKADVIEYLLLKDPTCALKVTSGGDTPLHLACSRGGSLNLTAVQLLFDAYPEAILKRNNYGKTPLVLAREYRVDTDTDYSEDEIAYLNSQRAQVINFLQAQEFYSNSSPESLVVQDDNGRTRLHQALKNKAPLGTIKLLVKKSSAAVRIHDNNMVFPLHIACEFSSFKVVQYLMETMERLDACWKHLDVNNDSILHYACRGGNCDVVKYLLDKQNPHVSEHNADQKLPIQLFCESGSSVTNAGDVDRLTNTGENDNRPRVAPESFAWICDRCQVARFRTFDEAEAHEEMCSGPVFDSVRAFNDLDRTDTIYRLLLAYSETVRDYV